MNNASLMEFDFAPRTRIVFGPGSIRRLGEFARELGGHRVLLVTDPGLVRAGHADRAGTSLRQAGLVVGMFDRVVENPTTEVVDMCVVAARELDADFLVALGGGSSMDAAKGCNFLLSCGGKMEDYWGVGKATGPMLPLIAAPTTTGTGSECQSFALITHAESHVKMACGDVKAAARIALLDPELTVSQPRHVAFCTGIDALAHAVESAVSRRRNPASLMLSQEAFRACGTAMPRLFGTAPDLAALSRMQWGAAWAGMAIENSMLGAAHAAANPLTRRYGLTHGLAVGLMLPSVVRLNGELPSVRQTYRELLLGADLLPTGPGGRDSAETLAAYLEHCFQLGGPAPLPPGFQIPETDVPELADQASHQWTAGFNPRPVSAPDFQQLYRTAAENLP